MLQRTVTFNDHGVGKVKKILEDNVVLESVDRCLDFKNRFFRVPIHAQVVVKIGMKLGSFLELIEDRRCLNSQRSVEEMISHLLLILAFWVRTDNPGKGWLKTPRRVFEEERKLIYYFLSVTRGVVVKDAPMVLPGPGDVVIKMLKVAPNSKIILKKRLK